MVGSFLAAAIFYMRPPRYSDQAALPKGGRINESPLIATLSQFIRNGKTDQTKTLVVIYNGLQNYNYAVR